MERRILCMELWPHLGAAAEDVVFADNAGYNWHFRNGDWRKDPQPTSRAIPVLDLVGVEWRREKEDLDINHADNGSRPALPAHWPRLTEPEQRSDDPIFAAIEAHRAADAELGQAVAELEKAEQQGKRAVRRATKRSDEAGEAECHALAKVLSTAPTTVGGIAALAEYILHCEEAGTAPLSSTLAGRFDPSGQGHGVDTAALVIQTIATAARNLRERLAA
jgi:hypothetical protein